MVTQTSELFRKIRTAVDAETINVHALAIEAGLSPSTVYDMLRPDWRNRAVDNVEAVAAAFDRLTSKTRRRRGTRAKTRGR